MIDAGLPPKIRIILRAILLCRFHSSIAIAIRNPPRKRNMIELIYDDAISSVDKIPVKGKKIIGINEVAARGIASVIQSTAINSAIADIVFICGLAGSKSPTIMGAINTIAPIT
jgi:hypothetical protein